MKLSDDQRRHLYDLSMSTGRPEPESDTLVRHGLAQRGSGHFGEWVRITAKGRELVESWTDANIRAFMTAVVSCEDTETAPKPDRTQAPQQSPTRREARTRTATPTSPLPSRGGNSKAESPSTPRPIDAVKAGRSKAGGAVPFRQVASSAPSEAAATGGTPNAVRVVIGSRVTYYPLDLFESLKNGTKQRCFTRNKLYRSYSLATSTADDRLF